MFANKRIKRQRLELLHNREEVPDPHKHLNPADAQNGKGYSVKNYIPKAMARAAAKSRIEKLKLAQHHPE